MRILHINTTDYGGAAWCAMRISKALSDQGVECRFLIAEGSPQENVIVAKRDEEFWYSNYFLGKVKHLLMRTPFFWDKEKMDKVLKEKNAQLESPLFIHGPFSYYKNITNHPLFEWADIIHLHWVPDFIDYPSFFRQVKKPIIWTLHDKFPAVGVQHYCSEFFPVPDALKHIDTLCRRIKRNSVLKAKNLRVVAISSHMKNICKDSDVLSGIPVTLIHNGVDTEVFHPYDKRKVRKSLGLPTDAVIFYFSAYYIHDFNKGLDRVIEALRKVEVPNKMLICSGRNNPDRSIPRTEFPIVLTDLLKDQTLLSQYYSASDYFLQCSFEETFSQTPMEAMACGIPVISTPCSGATDLIRPFNGIVCCGFDSDSICAGITMALSSNFKSAAIREFVIENFRYERIAEKYINLYDSLL